MATARSSVLVSLVADPLSGLTVAPPARQLAELATLLVG